VGVHFSIDAFIYSGTVKCGLSPLFHYSHWSNVQTSSTCHAVGWLVFNGTSRLSKLMKNKTSQLDESKLIEITDHRNKSITKLE